MRDVSCILLSKSYLKDKNGNILKENGREKFEIKKVETPIISVEKVWKDEFYKANEQGYKPSLRLRISALNYDNQPELIYMNKTYNIIRTQEITADELILICERKVKNVKSNKN